MRKISWMIGAAMMMAFLGLNARAGEEGQGGGQRRQFDPEQFRQRMQERMKESLGVNDDEWKALQPKIDAVQKAQQQTRGGMGGMFRGGRRGGGGGNNPAPAPAAEDPNAAPKSEVEKKSTALQTLADNKEADGKAVKDALKEFRDAREKARADLKKAQDELKELLTPRQEAQLVLIGLLE